MVAFSNAPPVFTDMSKDRWLIMHVDPKYANGYAFFTADEWEKSGGACGVSAERATHRLYVPAESEEDRQRKKQRMT